MYRYEARSVAGFIQQLAVAYASKDHHLYCSGWIPPGKNVRAVDQKLLELYGVNISKWARWRRRQAGAASIHYLRHDRFWILIATRGNEHRLFEHSKSVRNLEEAPIYYRGYSVSYRSGGDGKMHASVRIELKTYLRLKQYLMREATKRSADWLWKAFQRIPFEPYAPVRRQLFNIHRAVNRRRRTAGLELIPYAALRLSRRQVKVFVTSSLPPMLNAEYER